MRSTTTPTRPGRVLRLSDGVNYDRDSEEFVFSETPRSIAGRIGCEESDLPQLLDAMFSGNAIESDAKETFCPKQRVTNGFSYEEVHCLSITPDGVITGSFELPSLCLLMNIPGLQPRVSGQAGA